MNVGAYKAILRRLGVEPTGADQPDPETVARLLNMPLDVFAREGQPLEVRVECWPENLFFVPDVRHAEALWREGIARERVWTASELIALLEGAPWAPEALQLVMVARREFGGEVVPTSIYAWSRAKSCECFRQGPAKGEQPPPAAPTTLP